MYPSDLLRFRAFPPLSPQILLFLDLRRISGSCPRLSANKFSGFPITRSPNLRLSVLISGRFCLSDYGDSARSRRFRQSLSPSRGVPPHPTLSQIGVHLRRIVCPIIPMWQTMLMWHRPGVPYEPGVGSLG